MILKKAYDGKEMRAFRALYGKNYVESGWLEDVRHCKEGDIHFLKATVSPSQPGVGRSEYQSWAALSDDGIVTGQCTCPAGAGRSYSHIASVLYAVIMAWEYGVAGEGCTDRRQVWGRGASKILSAGEDFQQIVNDDHITKKKIKSDSIPNRPQFIDHSDLVDFAAKCSVSALWQCETSMLKKVLTAPEMKQTVRHPLQHSCHDLSDTTKPCIPTCTPCTIFMQKYVLLNKEQVKLLEEQTKEQNSTLWLDSRRVRLTASSINSIPKTARGNPEKFVTGHIHNRFKGSAATRHGTKSEPIARRWFETTQGLTVRKSGLVVSSDELYLAASLDGLINDCTILEIKCPTKPVQDLIKSEKYDVRLDASGKAYLSPTGKNGYYTQVQTTMYCTKTTMCKFLVWTESDQIIVDVPYDKKFMDSLLPRVRAFYFKHLLVRIVDEHHFQRLEFSPAFKNLCT
ncbi:uncharacterized protein LOC127835044 [Dreissena polymorpha]|uniref:uncharacterized protein LOC127835044 n=1 Tax=Dreissena polymorpha TaxID=45954 RepID=UPI002264AD6B|nr:uncharacterized protein LOC127835044 [Dreissena polymorpha]